jgi:hypothetical protein
MLNGEKQIHNVKMLTRKSVAVHIAPYMLLRRINIVLRNDRDSDGHVSRFLVKDATVIMDLLLIGSIVFGFNHPSLFAGSQPWV